MKGVVAYLAVDGQVHVWDGASRGGNPLCGIDTFPLDKQPDHTLAEGCLSCGEHVYEAVLAGDDV